MENYHSQKKLDLSSLPAEHICNPYLSLISLSKIRYFLNLAPQIRLGRQCMHGGKRGHSGQWRGRARKACGGSAAVGLSWSRNLEQKLDVDIFSSRKVFTSFAYTRSTFKLPRVRFTTTSSPREWNFPRGIYHRLDKKSPVRSASESLAKVRCCIWVHHRCTHARWERAENLNFESAPAGRRVVIRPFQIKIIIIIASKCPNLVRNSRFVRVFVFASRLVRSWFAVPQGEWRRVVWVRCFLLTKIVVWGTSAPGYLTNPED